MHRPPPCATLTSTPCTYTTLLRSASASSDSGHGRHEVTKIKSELGILAARPNGEPRPNNFGIEDVELPEIEDGEVRLATRYLSLDPYMRGRMDDRKSYSAPTAVGGVMEGETVDRKSTRLNSSH